MNGPVLVLSGLRIHTVPKVASTAISACLAVSTHRRAEPWEGGDEYRFMAVRHPLDRLVSAWGYFTQGTARRLYRARNGLHEAGVTVGMEFPDFLRVVLEHPNCDQHIRPQVRFKGPHPIDQIVRIESLSDAWPGIVARSNGQLVGPIEVKNKSDRSNWSFSKADERLILEAYSADAELYENAA